jgi:hypothetical protein
MACNTSLNGITDDICNVFGGVVAVGIGVREDVDTLTVAAGEVTAMTVTPNMSTYFFKEGQAFADGDSNVDFESGVTTFENRLTLHAKGQTLLKRNELMALSEGQKELYAIYKMDTGTYWAIGLTSEDEDDSGKLGARLSSIGHNTGQQRSDTNEFTFVLSVTMDKALPLAVNSTVADALFNPLP